MGKMKQLAMQLEEDYIMDDFEEWLAEIEFDRNKDALQADMRWLDDMYAVYCHDTSPEAYEPDTQASIDWKKSVKATEILWRDGDVEVKISVSTGGP